MSRFQNNTLDVAYSDEEPWPPKILVPESSPLLKSSSLLPLKRDPIHLLSSDPPDVENDPKLKRLQEVFGSLKSTQVLREALDKANGSLAKAIHYAAMDNSVESDDSFVASKKRKLVKKKDLPRVVEQQKDESKLNEILDDDSSSLDLEILDKKGDSPQVSHSRYKVNRIHVIPSSPAQDFAKPSSKKRSKMEKKSVTKIQEDLEDDYEEDEPVSEQEQEQEDPEEEELIDAETTDDESEGNDYHDSTEFENQTVTFFNTCTVDELIKVTSCSEDQANFIMGQRSFDNMHHLRTTLSSGRRKFISVLERYEETMQGYAQADELIEKCRVYGEELNAVLKGWGLPPSSNEMAVQGELCMIDLPQETPDLVDTENDCIREQPDFINPEYQLKSYQLLGISWLNLLYSKGLSGILADEMGLGKTAQVIAFLGYLMEQGVQGPHLIVAPSSTLENWMREIEKWCPTLTYRSYYGGQNERYESQEEILENIDDINIIVTTYNMATGNKEDRSFLRKLRCTSMILDEGHMIKNMESARYKYLSQYKARFRLLMTGTPLQNNLMELLALLTFIMPELFSSDVASLSKIFAVKRSLSSRGDETLLCKQRVQRAKEIMTPFVLRRRKDQVVKELPRKIVDIQKYEPTEHQLAVYQNILNESRKTYLEATAAENSSKAAPKASKQLSNVLMQLRKAANHPLLVRYHYNNDLLKQMARQIMREPEYCDANQDYIYEDMTYMSDFELLKLCNNFPKSLSKFALKEEHWMDAGKVQALQTLLPQMKERGDRILIFSQFVIMLDILEKVMETLGIKFVRLDGQTKVDQRQTLIDEFNNDDTITVFLISTKAGGVGINLTSANVVIIYDMDFNPHNDKQAEDRAHRVGQTRDVNVVKFVIKGTIEEHILRLAETKIKLDERIRGEESDGEQELDDNMMNALRNDMKL